MKVKDYDCQLSKLKVKIPDKYKHDCILIGLKTQEVYIISQWFKGIWVKPDLKSERMYPLQIPPCTILDWDVIE